MGTDSLWLTIIVLAEVHPVKGRFRVVGRRIGRRVTGNGVGPRDEPVRVDTGGDVVSGKEPVRPDAGAPRAHHKTRGHIGVPV